MVTALKYTAEQTGDGSNRVEVRFLVIARVALALDCLCDNLASNHFFGQRSRCQCIFFLYILSPNAIGRVVLIMRKCTL